ncbi:MAG: hypothetical protein CMQ14_13280 [Gammaproteobacteria bacterium]|nr:hypothetical protein [Gammaproteobacteria bacterium]
MNRCGHFSLPFTPDGSNDSLSSEFRHLLYSLWPAGRNIRGLAAGMEIAGLVGKRPSDPEVETDCAPRMIKLLLELQDIQQRSVSFSFAVLIAI